MKESYDYIINVGYSNDELEPYDTAYSSEVEAIEEAKWLVELEAYGFTEVVYMPEDDDDINEVVWRSWDNDDDDDYDYCLDRFNNA